MSKQECVNSERALKAYAKEDETVGRNSMVLKAEIKQESKIDLTKFTVHINIKCVQNRRVLEA